MAQEAERTQPEAMTEGWACVWNSSKAHYFRESHSMCRRLRYFGEAYQQGEDGSGEHCRSCRQALASVSRKQAA